MRFNSGERKLLSHHFSPPIHLKRSKKNRKKIRVKVATLVVTIIVALAAAMTIMNHMTPQMMMTTISSREITHLTILSTIGGF